MSHYFQDSYQGAGAIAAAAPAPRSAPAPMFGSGQRGASKMSYFPNTTLVARRGYGARNGIAGMDGVIDDFGSGLKKLGAGVLSVYGAGKESAGAAAAYKEIATAQAKQQQSGMPSWVVPVAIGGIGLVAIVLLMKRRK